MSKILSVKKSLKKASGGGGGPAGRQSLNRRIRWARGRALNCGTIALDLMFVCCSPRWISSAVNLSRFAGPRTKVGCNTSLLMSPASFSRSWSSILA
jgi:hypothetical protein